MDKRKDTCFTSHMGGRTQAGRQGSLGDFRGEPMAIGDRVLAVGWGDGIPLWLSNATGTVVALGRSRIRVRFDGVRYDVGDRPHSAPATHFRRVGAAS
jgi:hypothetical protein